MTRQSIVLELPTATQIGLVAAAQNSERVRGLTHAYYKYPARFSPSFARAVIEAFTQAGDLVFDNHVGGGTTLVEALALGRSALGVDISSLAAFVSSTKTTVFDESELRELSLWVGDLRKSVNIHRPSVRLFEYETAGYYRHLKHPARWRLRKAIEQSLDAARQLRSPQLEAFGRCVVLRTAQWALDGRKDLPSTYEFREKLCDHATEMIGGAQELKNAVSRYSALPNVHVVHRSSAGIEADSRIAQLPAPKLVLTSPPYPGVHVLYHRWQIEGGKEAPLPFMIANKLDGAGSSFYTMGDRKVPELRTYFENVRATMTSVAAVADADTIIVQMVAFADASWQLPHYAKTMKEAGLTEVFLPTLAQTGDGRLRRNVPSRRWYSERRGSTPGSQEVVLFFRKTHL